MQDSTAKKRDLLKLHIAADLITKNFPEIFHVQNLCFVQILSRIYISYIFRTFSVQKFRTVSVLKKNWKNSYVFRTFSILKKIEKKNSHIFRIFSGYSNHQKKSGRKIWSFFGSKDRHFPDISRYTRTFLVTISGHSFFIGPYFPFKRDTLSPMIFSFTWLVGVKNAERMHCCFILP